MKRIRTLFLWLTLIGPLHMGEQLLTGLDEFYSIKQMMAGYYAQFAPEAADHATVVLITMVWTLISVVLYLVLMGGKARLAVMGFIGVFGISEWHHLPEALWKGAYDPGLWTCLPYGAVGALLTAAVWREWKNLGAPTESLRAPAAMLEVK